MDRIYKTRREKYNAILDEVERLHGLGWPILIGTVTVDVSETLSRQLKRRGLKHEVLNAKYHQREAEIVASAGQKSSITIATNMAGRGTDIKLGKDLDLAWTRPVSRSSAPSGTSPGGSTGSCAAARAARAIRGSRSSSSRWKTT